MPRQALIKWLSEGAPGPGWDQAFLVQTPQKGKSLPAGREVMLSAVFNSLFNFLIFFFIYTNRNEV